MTEEQSNSLWTQQERLTAATERLAVALERYTAEHDFERVMTAAGDAQAVSLLQAGWKVIHVQSVDPFTDRQKEQAGGQLSLPTLYMMGLPRQRREAARPAITTANPAMAGQPTEIQVPTMSFRRPTT